MKHVARKTVIEWEDTHMKVSQVPVEVALASLAYHLRLVRSRTKRRHAQFKKLQRISSRAMGMTSLEWQVNKAITEARGYFRALLGFEGMEAKELGHLLSKDGAPDKTAGRNSLGRTFGKQGGT